MCFGRRLSGPVPGRVREVCRRGPCSLDMLWGGCPEPAASWPGHRGGCMLCAAIPRRDPCLLESQVVSAGALWCGAMARRHTCRLCAIPVRVCESSRVLRRAAVCMCMCVHLLAPPAPIAVRFELVCVGGRHTDTGVSDVPHGLPWPAASPCAILVHEPFLPCSGVARQGAATTTSCTTSS